MRMAVFLFYFLVPHFRTIHYFKLANNDGSAQWVFIEDPEQIDQEYRRYIHAVSFFCLFGKPCFPRYFAYQSA